MIKTLNLLLLLCLLGSTALMATPSIDPNSVAILYNTNDPESKELADYYANARKIPSSNLIGLPTSKQGKITRDEYNKTIRDPLINHFSSKQWWKTTKTQQGLTITEKNKIRLLVCMRGIPYGINLVPAAPPKDPNKKAPQLNAFTKFNNASVDSELAAIGIQGYPIEQSLANKYFKQDIPFTKATLPFQLLVGRIDHEFLATCKRMIDDAITVEKTGLYGMCYLDLAFKGGGYKMGDDWILDIEKQTWKEGIPTTIEKTKDTYLTNYPMRDVALYYGWYTTHKNGPFLNPNLKLKKGSIAIHLHSYSASNLRNSNKNWTGPILQAGAAATVGNVYEPYLSGTHHFNILNDRLLKGYTLIESAYMAIPLLSWQNVVIGDPLYQPFKNLNTNQEKPKKDKFYQAVRAGFNAWKGDPDLLTRKLRTAALKTNDARYYEVVGLYKRFVGKTKEAMLFFSSAEKMYLLGSDKTRMGLHNIELLRELGEKDKAILTARAIYPMADGTPEQQTIKSILNILSPPPPPKATPKNSQPNKSDSKKTPAK